MTKGTSIEECTVVLDNRFTEAGWCRVDHQSTENFIIGRLIEPIKINIAIVFSLTSLFSNVWFKKIIIK